MYTRELLAAYKNNIVAINEDGNKIFYADLLNISNQIVGQLDQRSFVFCLCKNTFGSLAGYVSFISNKIVPLLLDANLDEQLLNELIRIYKPQYLWVPNEKSAQFNDGTEVFVWEDYSLLKLESNESVELHPDLALLFATSGSTGSPKLVRISYENLSSNAESIAEYLSITDKERPITALPMNYSFGLSIINSHLFKGATLLLTNKSVMEKEFWNLLKSEKATSLSGVPYTFEILSKLRFSRMDLPHLKTMTQAGGKLNINYVKEFAEYCHSNNKRFFVMYGQTEATARMSYLPNQYALSKAGSMGDAIPGGEFWLIDENRQIISETESVGELVYKGKNVSMGYAQNLADLAKADENNGVLYTGDMAKRDADNCYTIVGRQKRFIKLFGNRVNLDDTEQILKNIISDCACVGIDDQMIIYITDQDKIQETQQYIAAKTGINLKAFSVKFIKDIPKNHSGKTVYSKLVVN